MASTVARGQGEQDTTEQRAEGASHTNGTGCMEDLNHQVTCPEHLKGRLVTFWQQFRMASCYLLNNNSYNTFRSFFWS